MKNDGGPAFPFALIDASKGKQKNLPGMSLRDYFAATVDPKMDVSGEFMEKMLGRKRPGFSIDPRGYLEYCAEFEALVRGIFADAMLAERAK